MTVCNKAQLRGKYYLDTALMGDPWGKGMQALLVAIAEGSNACRDIHW